MDSGITFQEFLEYTRQETRRWRDWFTAHPEVLDVSCDIAKAGTVRALLLHVFTTELFFAHALLDQPKPDWESLRPAKVDELFGINDEAHHMFQEFLAKANVENWNAIIELGVGGLKASKRKMLAQALLHGVHHRGQLATFLRQQGFDGMWVHDLILTNVME